MTNLRVVAPVLQTGGALIKYGFDQAYTRYETTSSTAL